MNSTLDQRIDIAESEGGSKEYIKAALKELMNFDKNCTCHRPISYLDSNEEKMILEKKCLQCGGDIKN
jgi:hypothetical protein